MNCHLCTFFWLEMYFLALGEKLSLQAHANFTLLQFLANESVCNHGLELGDQLPFVLTPSDKKSHVFLSFQVVIIPVYPNLLDHNGLILDTFRSSRRQEQLPSGMLACLTFNVESPILKIRSSRSSLLVLLIGLAYLR